MQIMFLLCAEVSLPTFPCVFNSQILILNKMNRLLLFENIKCLIEFVLQMEVCLLGQSRILSWLKAGFVEARVG